MADQANVTAWCADRTSGLTRPGAPERAALLIDLGRRLQQHPSSDVRGIAFWLRPLNVRALAARASGAAGPVRSFARGVIVQYLPGNTSILGIYTWTLSFLCGNRTALRLSARTPDLEADLYSAVLHTLADHGAEAEASTIVVRCTQDDMQMQELSAAADVRLIWGTDASVQAVRGLPSSPSCRDVAFGDRRSLASLSARTVLALTDQQIAHLAHTVVRDVAWSLHQACSAPRSLVWVGDRQTVAAASDRFADALQKTANPLLNTLSAGGHLERLTWAQLSVIEGMASRYRSLSNGLTLLDGTASYRPDSTWPAGLLTQTTIPSLPALAPLLLPADQTLAVFGFERHEVEDMIGRVRPGTIRRIVAVGDSHRFDAVWDGYDLIDELTSKVAVSLRAAGDDDD